MAAGAVDASGDNAMASLRGSPSDAGGRNKRSIGIHLKSNRGREIYWELV